MQKSRYWRDTSCMYLAEMLIIPYFLQKYSTKQVITLTLNGSLLLIILYTSDSEIMLYRGDGSSCN